MNTKYPQFDCCESIGTIPIYSHSVKMKRKKAIRMFDLVSPFYDVMISSICLLRGGRSYEEHIRREALAQLDFKRGHRLLDVGIGTGVNFLYLQPRPQFVVGIDPSIGMLRQCARRLLKLGIQGELFCHSAEKLCFANNEFDRIMCGNVLMHASSHPRVLKEMLRVLKPTGKLVITVNSSWLSRQEKPLFQGMDREILVTKPTQALITVLTIQPRKSNIQDGSL